MPNTIFVVADCDNKKGSNNGEMSREQKEYNARLIARAPEMLQTLCDLRDSFQGGYDGEWAKMTTSYKKQKHVSN
jgi:hypothetical protein